MPGLFRRPPRPQLAKRPLPPIATGVIAFVQNLGDKTAGTAGTTTVLSISKTVTVGNTIIVPFGRGPMGTTPTCADNLGNTYTADSVLEGTTSTGRCIFSAPVTTGGTLTTITITHATMTYRAMIAAEFSGVGAFSADSAGDAYAVGTTGNFANSKTIPAGGLVVGAIVTNDDASASFAAGAASGSPSTTVIKDAYRGDGSNFSIGLLHAIAGASEVTGFTGQATWSGECGEVGIGGIYAASAGGSPQTVTLGLLDASATVYAPTVSFKLGLPLIDAGPTLYAPTLVPKNLLTVGFLDASPAVYAPTLVPKNLLSLDLLDASAALYAPTVTFSLGLPLVDAGPAVYDPIVRGLNAIVLGILDAGNAIYTVTLVPKNTLDLGLLDAGAALYEPTIPPPTAPVGLPFLDGGAAIYDVTVVRLGGLQTISLDLIDGQPALYTPEVQQDQFVIVSLLDAGPDLYAPTVMPDQFLSLDFLDAGRALYAPTVMPDQFIVAPDTIESSGRALYAPTLTTINDLIVPLIDGAAEIYAVTAEIIGGVKLLELSLIDDGNAVYAVTIANTLVTISGYTRNQYGAIIGNCTVDLFRSSDNEFMGTTTSDALGHYSIGAAPGVEHFLVAYSAAKVYGVTARDIVGV